MWESDNERGLRHDEGERRDFAPRGLRPEVWYGIEPTWKEVHTPNEHCKHCP